MGAFISEASEAMLRTRDRLGAPRIPERDEVSVCAKKLLVSEHVSAATFDRDAICSPLCSSSTQVRRRLTVPQTTACHPCPPGECAELWHPTRFNPLADFVNGVSL